MNNMKIQSARKATHTWLAGKIKCGNCGYALMSIFNPSGKQYLRCTKRLDTLVCAVLCIVAFILGVYTSTAGGIM